MSTDFLEQANLFKAFCDEKRMRILNLLLEGEECVCVLMEQMALPQSTLSYHMRILCDSCVVEGRQDGKWTYYRINPQGINRARAFLNTLRNVEDKQRVVCT